jgi:hypothetical protein
VKQCGKNLFHSCESPCLFAATPLFFKWTLGHLVQPVMPEDYGFEGLVRENLPIISETSPNQRGQLMSR